MPDPEEDHAHLPIPKVLVQTGRIDQIQIRPRNLLQTTPSMLGQNVATAVSWRIVSRRDLKC
jgi:hypothetical protein